jgi:hypothetical protein
MPDGLTVVQDDRRHVIVGVGEASGLNIKESSCVSEDWEDAPQFLGGQEISKVSRIGVLDVLIRFFQMRLKGSTLI